MSYYAASAAAGAFINTSAAAVEKELKTETAIEALFSTDRNLDSKRKTSRRARLFNESSGQHVAFTRRVCMYEGRLKIMS